MAILSAVETVNPKMPSTLDAAALCKMADRGQITGGLLDGPLALDNAISPEAARIKGIVSPVAGQADILVVPDLEAGNMLAKNLSFLANADAAGIVLGARVPIILTSRADNVRTRMASCAVAALYAHTRREQPPGGGMTGVGDTLLVDQCRLVEHQVRAVRRRRPATGSQLALKGQLDGIGTRPHLIGQGCRRRDAGRRDLAAGRGSGRGRRHWAGSATGCSASSAACPARGRPPRRPWRRRTTPRRSWSTTRCWSGSSGWCRWRRCTSRTIWRRSARSARAQPAMPQVACFDTAFHRGHPEVADRFAIPDALYQEGVRRYGFHGLSYEYIAEPAARGRPGAGAGPGGGLPSGPRRLACARIQDGRSIDSTMGFTAVDGLPMGTRTGQLDPGVMLYLMQAKGLDAARIERFLYHEGGLKGLSGISNDMRDLLASDAPGAALALDYFVYRIVREAGALAAAMGGIDGIVFTAGIGEHSPDDPRAGAAQRLAWLGVELDAGANARHGPLISTAGQPSSRPTSSRPTRSG